MPRNDHRRTMSDGNFRIGDHSSACKEDEFVGEGVEFAEILGE